MWWGRRDAFCRIACAALWPAGCELSFLLAEDLSVLRCDARLTEALPAGTEQDPRGVAWCRRCRRCQELVRAWRRAMTSSGARGAVCVRLGGKELGRREMIEELQQRMDLAARRPSRRGRPKEFLRSRGLNKSVGCLLKSMSKQKLLEAYAQVPSLSKGSQLLEQVTKQLQRLPCLARDSYIELTTLSKMRRCFSTGYVNRIRCTALGLWLWGLVSSGAPSELGRTQSLWCCTRSAWQDRRRLRRATYEPGSCSFKDEVSRHSVGAARLWATP